MTNEFQAASELERDKMLQFIPTFSQSLKQFKYKFSPSTGYDCYDLLMKINDTNCVGEVKVRYNHYNSGYYLEKQKYDNLKAKYPDTQLFYFCISITGVYVYNLNKVDFETIKLSTELLPKTSAKQSKLIKKDVYTLPLTGNFIKYYELFLL